SHPELADARRRVGDALVRVSAQRNAMTVLGAGASLAEEVAANIGLWGAATAPAAHVYTGVLYEAAGAHEWTGATLARAADRVRIVSALWGAVSPADDIPAYRLSIGTSLGRLGPLTTFWRTRLATSLDALARDPRGGTRLVVDCRSSGYVAAWRPDEAEVVGVRVLRELDGTRAVVSHMAKHTRGLLTRRLLAEADAPQTPAELADLAADMVGA